MEGRLYRTQSLSTVATTRGRAASVDPFAGISKIRDDDFRKSILDKVNRVQRSLSVKPEGDDASRSRNRQRHHSSTESTRPSTVYLPVKTSLHTGIVLPTGGNVEYWPTTVTDPDGLAVRYGSVQPESRRRAVDIDKLVFPTAVVITRKRVIDEADDAVNRGSRISTLLEQLKTIDGPRSRYQQEIDKLAVPSRAADREEIDSFASVLNKLTLPVIKGPKSQDLRYRGPIFDPVYNEDFRTRLAHACGDLERIEGLASQAFKWNDRPASWTTASLKTIESKVAEATDPSSDTRLVEIRTTRSPREIFTFYNDKSVGIKQTDSAAEQAIRWAQQRRLQLESELDTERKRERYSIHNLPTTVSALGLVPRTRASRPSTYRPYSRSLSASQVDLARAGPADRTPRRYDLPTEGPATRKSQAKPAPVQHVKAEMSDTRRRVREVLAKSKGDPNYFENRKNQQIDDY